MELENDIRVIQNSSVYEDHDLACKNPKAFQPLTVDEDELIVFYRKW